MPKVESKIRDRARRLRTEPTKAEMRLWYLLRRKQLNGWHFRRQHPIPPYIADFACLEAKLAIEADGGQHDPDGSDRKRDAHIKARGWRILRFWNHEILQDSEGVIQRVLSELAPSLPAPASRGRESAESPVPGVLA